VTETQDQLRERISGYIKHNATKDAAGLFDLIQQGHAQVMSSIDGLSEEQSTFQPGPGDWSVLKTMQHVVDGKMDTARVCAALVHSSDAENLDGEGERVGCVIPEYTTLHETRKAAVEAHDAIVAFVRTLNDHTDLAAKHPHFLFGPLNCREWIVFQRVHDGDHGSQIDQIKATDGFPAST
jgi:hypothetical protein